MAKMPEAITVAIVTLGCPKNVVDSEVMGGTLQKAGYRLVSQVQDAQVLVVNTCGFLERAVSEGIDCILELAQLKQQGVLRRLVVVGCMVARYGPELRRELPEVDEFLASADLAELCAAVAGGSVARSGSNQAFLYDHRSPRLLSAAQHSAYMKIAEGCARRCSFCAIPAIKGAFHSRELDSLLAEAAQLGSQGVRELNLIAQDVTGYGRDLNQPGVDLTRLLIELDRQAAVPWLRLLYCYPTGVSPELLSCFAELETLVEYLDLPLQHCSERILRLMRRPVGRFAPQRLVDFIRREQPELHLRTAFIVGFPGETEADIRQLESFVAEGHFSHLGIFTYSAEAGTAAAELTDDISAGEKEDRMSRIMAAQQQALARRSAELVGRRLEVMLDGPHPETEFLLSARTRFQAPEVDAQVLINDATISLDGLDPGHLLEVEITEVLGYDLVGRVCARLG